VQTRRLCEEHAVLFAYKGRVYNLADTNDRFVTGLDALLDERYADEVRDRVMRGLRTSLARNTARGKIPFGYKRIYDPGTGAMTAQVPDPKTAPIVRELFNRIVAGDGLYTIAADFNRRGVPTPQEHRDARRGVADVVRGGWTSSKIRRQVGNPQIAGFRVHRGKRAGDAGWEPLVSAEQFQLVRRILDDPSRRTQRGVEPRWLLSGILECGECGATCRRISNRGLPSYSCHGRNYDNKACVCGRQEPIDAYVIDALLKRLKRPDALEVLQGGHAADVERSSAERELAELEAYLEEYRLAAEQHKVSAQTMMRVESSTLPKIEEARRRCTPAWVPPALAHLVGMDDVEAGWHTIGNQPDGLLTHREMIAGAMRVVLHKDRRPAGSRGFDFGRIQIDWRAA
jgi:hypothetical protein